MTPLSPRKPPPERKKRIAAKQAEEAKKKMEKEMKELGIDEPKARRGQGVGDGVAD